MDGGKASQGSVIANSPLELHKLQMDMERKFLDGYFRWPFSHCQRVSPSHTCVQASVPWQSSHIITPKEYLEERPAGRAWNEIGPADVVCEEQQ